jgi:hypothetical protein
MHDSEVCQCFSHAQVPVILKVLDCLTKGMQRCFSAVIESPGASLAERRGARLATAAQVILPGRRGEWSTAARAQRRLDRQDEFPAHEAKTLLGLNQRLTPQAPLRVQKREHRSEDVVHNACYRPPATPLGRGQKFEHLVPIKLT